MDTQIIAAVITGCAAVAAAIITGLLSSGRRKNKWQIRTGTKLPEIVYVIAAVRL